MGHSRLLGVGSIHSESTRSRWWRADTVPWRAGTPKRPKMEPWVMRMRCKPEARP